MTITTAIRAQAPAAASTPRPPAGPQMQGDGISACDEFLQFD
jgi:ribosomal protein L11